MKVIYLDIDEEITAVIDKVKRTKGYDLALVIPKRSILTQSIVNLKLLRKQVEAIGKNVVVVVSEKNAYNLAKRAGLDVRSDIPIGGKEDTDSLGNLQEEISIDARSDIRTTKKQEVEIADSGDLEVHSYLENEEDAEVARSSVRRKPLIDQIREDEEEESRESVAEKLKKPVFIPRLGVKIFLAFLGVSFVVAGLIFFVLLPKAEITITPEKEQYIATQDVVVEASRNDFDLANRTIPGELLFFEDESDSKKFTADGVKDISTKARGTVTVFNSFSSTEQPLVASTRFQSADGKIYRLVSDASIPGASIEGGQAIPGSTQVTVEADEPGPEYNLSSGALTIPGLTPAKQQDIYGEISGAISGGESKTLRVVSEEDVARAADELAQPLYEKLSEKLTSKIDNSSYFFSDAVKNEVIERTLSTEVDSEAEEFELSVKVRSSTLVFDRSYIEQIVQDDVARAVSEEKYLLDESVQSGVSAELLNFDFEEQRMGVQVKIEKDLVYELDTGFIRQELEGKNEEEIAAFLDTVPHIDGYSIELWPFWVNRAPKIDKKVQIILDTDK